MLSERAACIQSVPRDDLSQRWQTGHLVSTATASPLGRGLRRVLRKKMHTRIRTGAHGRRAASKAVLHATKERRGNARCDPGRSFPAVGRWRAVEVQTAFGGGTRNSGHWQGASMVDAAPGLVHLQVSGRTPVQSRPFPDIKRRSWCAFRSSPYGAGHAVTGARPARYVR